MKTYLSVAIAALLITGTANAQHNAQKVNIGVKGGLNLYNINTENATVKNDVLPGFHVGMLAHIHLAPQIGLQPEVVYSAQGAKVGDTKYNLGYINVPVLVQYMFDNGFRLQAGPQVGFLVNANSKVNSGTKVNQKDNFKPVDLGLAAGVGYVHPPSGFGVDLRYNLGLNDISENTASKSTNRGGQLGVFYLFNHKK